MGKNETYEEFVEKFKPKLTTDDCYTPVAIYEAIKNWVVKEYNIQENMIVRPFYPGGDYENFDYTEDCIVVDNPPFSIISKIRGFYTNKNIKYFLFAPHLTLFSAMTQKCTFIVCDETITYENGARVNTDFCTNLETEYLTRTAPELKKAIKQANKTKEDIKSLPKYKYPDCVVSAASLGKITSVDFKLKHTESKFIRSLDDQKKNKKTIFGGGFLIAEIKAAEIKAAEIKAAEIKAAEIKAAEIKAAEKAIEWELSEREKEIIKSLKSTL